MRNTNVMWQKRATALLVLCAAGLLSACNDDPAAEPPSLTEEHGLQVAASHYHDLPLLTPEQSAERGFRYCPVYGYFFVAVRSAFGTLPKDMTATALTVQATGMAPVLLELDEVRVETVKTAEWKPIFSDQEKPAREDRLHVRALACAADDSLVKNARLDLSLTARSGGREVILGGVSKRDGDGFSIAF